MAQEGKLANDPSIETVSEIADGNFLFVINGLTGDLYKIRGNIIKNLFSGTMANASLGTVPDTAHYTRYFATEAGTYTEFIDEDSNPITVDPEDGLTILYYNGSNWFKTTNLISLVDYALNGGSTKTVKQIDEAKTEVSDFLPVKNYTEELRPGISNKNGNLFITDSDGNVLVTVNTDKTALEAAQYLSNNYLVKNDALQSESRFAFAIADEEGNIAFAVKKDGTLVGVSEEEESEVETRGEIETFLPKRLYTYYNDLNGLKKSTSIFLDHCIKLTNTAFNNIRFDNGTDRIDFIPSLPASGETSIISKAIKTTKGDWEPTSGTISHVTTKLSAFDTPIKLLCIGDSHTYGQRASYFNSDDTNDVYWMQMLVDLYKLRIDNPSLPLSICVGKLTTKSKTFNYKGIDYTVTGCADGKSGTPLLAFLRQTELGRVRDGSQGLWDLLGLGNGSGTDWIDTIANHAIYSQVCEGENDPVLTGALYTYLGLGTPSAIDDTISTAEKNAILAACANRLDNPENPFFDKTKTGNHRFSIAKWLERYKTLASDGVTKLIAGSTAGTAVTDVNAYDVCLPTHIFIRLSQNDVKGYGNNAALFAADMQLIVEAIKDEYPTMKVGISGIDVHGTFFPELYPNVIDPLHKTISRDDSSYGYSKSLANSFYATGLGVNEDGNKAWIVPFFHTELTGMGMNMEPVTPTEFDNPLYPANMEELYWKLRDDTDTAHPGAFTHAAWGYQLLSWVLYTMTL